MIDKTRITAEHSLEANYLKYECTENEVVDEIAINIMKNDMPDFLLPMRILKKNGAMELYYTVGTQIALKYKDMTFQKKDFLRLYKGLLRPFIEGIDWMLDYHCYCIDPNYIFIDKNGKDVLFMYFPVSSCKNTDGEIIDFFREIIRQVSVEDDSSFLLKMFQYFSRENVTVGELYQIVETEMEKEKTQSAQMKSTTPKLNISEEKKTMVQNIAKPQMISQPEMAHQVQKSVQAMENQEQEKSTNSAISSLFGTKADSDKHKKNGLFGGIGKKNTKETSMNIQAQLSVDVPEVHMGAQDELMNALFGTDGKKDKKKSKSSGLFGNKKNILKEEKVIPKINSINEIPKNRTIAQQPILQKPVQTNPIDAQPVQNYEYTQIDSDQEITQIDGVHIETSNQYLQAMDQGMNGIPMHVDLNFSKERITFGRQSGDVRQPDIIFSSEYRRIGRMHACIQRENNNLYIVDLGSANGTVLNGEILVPNQPYLLKNNDVIGFVAGQPINYKVVL